MRWRKRWRRASDGAGHPLGGAGRRTPGSWRRCGFQHERPRLSGCDPGLEVDQSRLRQDNCSHCFQRVGGGDPASPKAAPFYKTNPHFVGQHADEKRKSGSNCRLRKVQVGAASCPQQAWRDAVAAAWPWRRAADRECVRARASFLRLIAPMHASACHGPQTWQMGTDSAVSSAAWARSDLVARMEMAFMCKHTWGGAPAGAARALGASQ